MSWIRRILTVGLGAGLCLLLPGCFGDSFGTWDLVTGVTRTSDGSTLAVVAVCRGYVNQATVEDDTDSNSWNTWQSAVNVTGVAMWPLAGDGHWKITGPLRGLNPGRRYGLDAAGNTGDPSNAHLGTTVDFTVEDVARLAPGEVLYQPFNSVGDPIKTPMAVFRSRACAGSGD